MTYTPPILEVSELTISFPGETTFDAVKDLHFHLSKGETLAIVGESGSGKSLTALSLIGLLPVSAKVGGAVLLAGKKLLEFSEKEWQQARGSEIGIVFQEPMSALNPVMKVGRQLSESISSHTSMSRRAAKEQALAWFGKVKLSFPEKIYNRYPHQLSGGQKQRVMIAMAMCGNPRLLIADEPTTALDATVQREIVMLMKELQQETGNAMIFITHDLSLAAQMADTIMVMKQGVNVEYGPAATIINAPVHPYTKGLIACRPSLNNKGKRLPVVSDFDGNGQISLSPLRDKTYQAPAELEVKDLSVWFPERKNILGKVTQYYKAVQDVSFTLQAGETLGLVGESGCGKTTLGRTLMGLTSVHSGHISYAGMAFAGMLPKEWQLMRRNIQLIFQDPYASLNPRMTVADMIEEPLRIHNIVPASEIKTETKRLIDAVGLSHAALKRYPHQFSGGQRQRIGIARALSLRPKVVICDESVSALDVSVQAQILNLLKDLQQELGLSYLFISHDLAIVHYMSDRILVMKQGAIIEEGSPDDILLRPQHAYTRELMSASSY